LIKPIQDKIYNAVKKLATDGSYAVIFDKSSELIMLYTNPKYDKSDDILKALGYNVQKKEAGGSKSPSSVTSGDKSSTPGNEKKDQDQAPTETRPKK
jgi:hypothetical protein